MCEKKALCSGWQASLLNHSSLLHVLRGCVDWEKSLLSFPEPPDAGGAGGVLREDARDWEDSASAVER